jgi:DNA-binding beta-propeller fold protein YncE
MPRTSMQNGDGELDPANDEPESLYERFPWQALILLVVLAILVAGCGRERGALERDSAKEDASGKSSAAGEKTVEKKYTPPEKLLSAPEPAASPPLQEKPEGEVIQLRSGPEGVVADSETGLVAVGLRNPDQLALVDGDSGRVIRTVNLSGSSRHLGLAAPGGPVLVPAEPSDSLVQVGLPEGKVIDETPVGNFPHNVAVAPGGRIFVISEAASTASVVENGEVIETIKTPPSPGGGAVTESGLVGIVGVKGLALKVYEADTLDSVDIIDAGEGPTHVEAGPRDRFYVADTRGDALLVYETHPELEQVARVPLRGGSPYGIAVDPRRDRLWVTLTAENRLVLFDLESRVSCKAAHYATVRQPNSVAVDQASGRVFVAGRTEEVLQVIDP